MEKIYKSGTNKGNRRIWIEGSVLLQFGFVRGLRFNRLMQSDRIVLIPHKEGKHRVAGTDKRPIIDLNGKYLNDLFGSRTHFAAKFSPASQPTRLPVKQAINITPCNEAGQ